MLRLILPLLLAATAGTDEPKGPQDGTFLLRGVDVWQADGGVLEARSLLVDDGRIVTIGGLDLPAPPAARVVEAEDGWIVYPGLVHAGYDKGVGDLADSPFVDDATDPKKDPLPAMERGTRKDFRGWLHVADNLEWDGSKHDDWRELGFTSAYVLPKEGLIRGRAAWVSLNALPLGDALLQRNGLLMLALTTRGRGYPGTPMAALAVLRQAFLDASHMKSGASRRKEDPDLLPLIEDTGRPLLFRANSAREIENVLDLARDFANGRRLVIHGGREADRMIDRIRAQNVAVLFRLDLDEAPKTDEKLKVKEGAERPWWQDPARLRDDRREQHARLVRSFERLRAAGIDCALVPGFNAKDWKQNFEQLDEIGFAGDDLMRALTVDVARLLDLEGVGAIASGSAADFFVSRGAWNPAEPELAWVFADGRGWEIPMPEPEDEEDEDEDGEEGDEDDEPSEADLSAAEMFDGEWEFTMTTPGGDIQVKMEIDTATSTVLVSSDQDDEVLEVDDLEWDESTFWFTFSPPDTDFEMTFRAEVFGEDAEGEVELPQGMGTMDAPGFRVSKPDGEVYDHVHVDTFSCCLTSGKEDDEQEPRRRRRGADAPGKPIEEGDFPAGHPEFPVELDEDRRPALALDGDVLLRNATLYTLTGKKPFVGDLLIEDGKISAIGDALSTVRAVPEVDAEGWHVMPGVIDAHSHLALASVNEGSLSITAECRIADMIIPEDVGVYRAAAGGTTIAQSLHGSANPIGGQAAVWELDVHRATIAELLIPTAKQGIKFALGENVKQSNFGGFGDRFPTSRSGVEAVYRRAFTRAQEYARERDDYRAGNNPGFRRDVRLEVLADILANKIHIQCHSYRADEILMFLNVCREFGIERPTFQHILEGYKVAPELAAYGAMGSTFSDWWAYKIEAYDAIPWNPYLMDKAGMVASINSDSDEMIRRLNTEAGKSLLYGGMSYDNAMALCTLNAAIQLRIEDRVGTLEVGKDGTISVYDAPPLSTYARCMLTLARGRVLFDHAEGHDAMWNDYGAAAAEFAAANAVESAPAAPPQRTAEDWSRWTRRGQGLTYLIRDANIHPVTRAPFQGSVLVADGLIREIWENGDAPASRPEWEEIDAHGMNLYPGLINTGDRIGLYEIGSVRGTVDSSEVGDDQPDLSIATAIHGDSTHFNVHRMSGITTSLVHGSRGRITGQAALVHLDGEVTPDFVAMPDIALHIRFPNVSRPKQGKAPERPDSIDELDEWFDNALDYEERRQRCIAAGAALPTRDLKLEAMVPYALGEKPVLIETRNWRTLAFANQWAVERGVSPIYIVGRDAWKVAGLLGMTNARVLAGPVHALPTTESDPYDAPYRNAGILEQAGCSVALRTNDPEVTRNLPFQAATAAAHGWEREAALRSLTIGAAEILGVDDFVGSIEEGKVADFFLCTGDPLDFKSRVKHMWIGGREIELRSKQTDLRDRYEARIDRAGATSR